jgi:DNA-binding NarL/FixJ family response regulator
MAMTVTSPVHGVANGSRPMSRVTDRFRSRGARGSTVLVVDADSLFVDAVTPRLESLDMHVIHVQGGHGRLPSADIVIVDADGPRGGKISFDDDREAPVARVMISSSLDYVGVRWAIQHGYSAAISKDIPLHRFEAAIGAVIDGDMVVEINPMAPSRRAVAGEAATAAMTASLTTREHEILAMLVDGATSAAIASRLSLSPHTVRTHIQNVMSKLQVHSRVEAVAYAVRTGLARPGAEREIP